MMNIRELLQTRPLLFDGAMGTYYKAAPGVECEQAQPLDIEALKAAIADTGYTVTGAEEKPYEKKGFFSFLKH